jgi:thiol-disulfide isomerase/thioredoxin
MAPADDDVDGPASGEPLGGSTAGAGAPSRRSLPWTALVISASFSLAVGLLVAWWIVKPTGTDGAITPDQLVSGSRPANVSVTGTAEVGRAAPRASFTYLDGSTGSLADFAGSTVILNFWGSTCAPCLREMPALERVHRDLGGTVTVLGVDVADGADSARRMIARTGASYAQVRDPRGTLMAAFRGTRLPHTVVIDGKGTVVAIEDGAQTEADFRRLAGAG